MYDFFRFDTDEERLSLLVRARKVALLAIQRYDLEWEHIRFIQLSDTITYKIETNSAKSYLLRIHSDRMSKKEIRSEHILLQALNKLDDLTVPEGVVSFDGSYVLEIDTEKGYTRPYVTMMRWIEGEHASGDFTDSSANKMGMMMGKLHEGAAAFVQPPDFVRPIYGAESFNREMAKLKRYYTCFFYQKKPGSRIRPQLRRLFPKLP